MRKDVKFGFAIGGVLLAVLIVYVLVVPNTDKNGNQVADIGAAPSNSQSQNQSQQTQSNVNTGSSASSATPKVESPNPATPSTPTEAPRQTVTPSDTAAKPADPFATSSSEIKSETPVASAASDNRGVDWAKILDGGQVSPPPLMSKTSGGSEASSPESASSSATSSNDSIAGADRSSHDGSSTSLMALSGASTGGSSSPATQPTNGQRTHVIQAHETLSSISAAAYGNPSHWKDIAAANPNINPNRLKTGTTITLPALTTNTMAKTSSSSTPSGSASLTAVDSKHEYRVQARDTLTTISIKLYGKADRVDKIYELNKEAIGANRDHLKLNQVLKLPEPPSVASR